MRVASCYGVAAVSEPEQVYVELTPLLRDSQAPVRAAAADALGQIGGAPLPDGLARASRDEVANVRAAAIRALGFCDDTQAVDLAVNALVDPDGIRRSARASRLCVSPAALRRRRPPSEALARSARAWPVERALVMDSVGAV